MDIEDYDFQTRVVVLLVAHNRMLHQYRSAISDELFLAEDHRLVVKTILEYFDKYQHPPDWDNLKFALEQSANPPEGISSWSAYVEGLRRIRSNGNLAYIYDRVEDFIRHRLLQSTITTAVQLWENHQHEAVVEAFRQYEKFRVSPNDGIVFERDIYNRISSPPTRDTVPTGIAQLDHIMKGGPAKSELTVIMAPTGTGKTTMLINMGVAAIMAGKKVYHFFAEQTEELVWEKYACRFTKESKETLRDSPKRYAYILQQLMERCQGSLRIAPCLGVPVKDLRSFVFRHGAPDVMIIDYADKLISTRQYTQMRWELSVIYDDLALLGKEFNIAMYTGSQTNRAHFQSAKPDLDAMAESWDKANASDNVLALCQTKEEKKMRALRIYHAKGRNIPDGEQIYARVMPDRCWIFFDPKGHETMMARMERIEKEKANKKK